MRNPLAPRAAAGERCHHDTIGKRQIAEVERPQQGVGSHEERSGAGFDVEPRATVPGESVAPGRSSVHAIVTAAVPPQQAIARMAALCIWAAFPRSAAGIARRSILKASFSGDGWGDNSPAAVSQ
jgi:hypothetical protein